jgi:2-hydroxy-3-oxopropionate reductase
VKQVVSEILPGIKKGSLFIDMSTISPGTTMEIYGSLKEKGVSALDAPVSGGQVGAEAGTLSIMAGGSEDSFNRALPVFQAMGKNIVLIGDAGAGQVTKACNQMIVGITIQAVAEAFSMAKKAGVDLEKMREVLLGGFAQSRILDLHGKRMIDGNFAPGFKVKLHKKDMGIALQTGANHNVSLKATELIAGLMNQLVSEGHGELDHSSLFMLQEGK